MCGSAILIVMQARNWATAASGIAWLKRFTTKNSRVEEGRGCVEACANGPVSLPRSSNRTCGFPASGFPTGFATDSREEADTAASAHSVHAEFAEDRFHAEGSDASRGHLVASDEEVSDTVVEVRLDRLVRNAVRAWTEV